MYMLHVPCSNAVLSSPMRHGYDRYTPLFVSKPVVACAPNWFRQFQRYSRTWILGSTGSRTDSGTSLVANQGYHGIGKVLHMPCVIVLRCLAFVLCVPGSG